MKEKHICSTTFGSGRLSDHSKGQKSGSGEAIFSLPTAGGKRDDFLKGKDASRDLLRKRSQLWDERPLERSAKGEGSVAFDNDNGKE